MVNPKAYEPISPEINQESFASLDSIKDSAVPKLDKIISEAMRIFNR